MKIVGAGMEKYLQLLLQNAIVDKLHKSSVSGVFETFHT